jgi:hypothetical protein
MRKKTLFIHCGSNKTGSSALQVWFAHNIDRLGEFGIHYPVPGVLEHLLDGKYGNGGMLAQFLKGSFLWQQVLPMLDAALGAECGKILISGETIQSGESTRFVKLKAYLEERGVDVTFISLARNVADHAFSVWGQEIKSGGSTERWEALLARYRAPFLRQLHTISAVFGRQSVIVLNYDTIKGSLVPSFLKVLGVTSPSFVGVDRVNRSLSAKELGYMLFINNLLLEKGLDRHSRNRASMAFSYSMLSKHNAAPLLVSLSPDQYALLATGNQAIVDEFNRSFLPDDPIAIARPDQISQAIALEELLEEDKVVASMLVDWFISALKARPRGRSKIPLKAWA